MAPKVLLIGPIPPPLGGITVLFKIESDMLAARTDIEAICVGFPGGGGLGIWHDLKRFAGAVWRVLLAVPRCDVVTVHASTTGMAFIGPVVCAVAKLWKRPLLVRKFGGGDYRTYRFPRRSLIRWTVRNADLYLAETKALVQAAIEDKVTKVRWFPNSRPMGPQRPVQSAQCRRFVYVGQVRPTKGIGEIIQAAERCDERMSVDVYGPFLDGLGESMFDGLKRVKYCGVLAPEKVAQALRGYHALLLPTYHTGEGYPGVILEAYQAGLPVITTRWRFLPEIVDESAGILIAPHDSDALYQAMMKLVDSPELYARLCQGTIQWRQMFSSEYWVDQFARYCRELSGEAGVSPEVSRRSE